MTAWNTSWRNWSANAYPSRLRLHDFGRQDVERMLHAIVATPSVARTIFAAPSTLPAGLLETIYTLIEGNPVFVEELLTSLIASGEVSFTRGVLGKDSAFF